MSLIVGDHFEVHESEPMFGHIEKKDISFRRKLMFY